MRVECLVTGDSSSKHSTRRLSTLTPVTPATPVRPHSHTAKVVTLSNSSLNCFDIKRVKSSSYDKVEKKSDYFDNVWMQRQPHSVLWSCDVSIYHSSKSLDSLITTDGSKQEPGRPCYCSDYELQTQTTDSSGEYHTKYFPKELVVNSI